MLANTLYVYNKNAKERFQCQKNTNRQIHIAQTRYTKVARKTVKKGYHSFLLERVQIKH